MDEGDAQHLMNLIRVLRSVTTNEKHLLFNLAIDAMHRTDLSSAATFDDIGAYARRSKPSSLRYLDGLLNLGVVKATYKIDVRRMAQLIEGSAAHVQRLGENVSELVEAAERLAAKYA